MQGTTFRPEHVDEKLEDAIIPQGEFTWTGEKGRYEFSIAAEKTRPEDIVKIIVERRAEKSPWLKIRVEPHGLVMLRVVRSSDDSGTWLYRATPRIDWKGGAAIGLVLGAVYVVTAYLLNAL